MPPAYPGGGAFAVAFRADGRREYYRVLGRLVGLRSRLAESDHAAGRLAGQGARRVEHRPVMEAADRHGAEPEAGRSQQRVLRGVAALEKAEAVAALAVFL